MKRILYCLGILFALLLNCNDSGTEPAPTELTLLKPAGGEIWLVGEKVDITWSSKNAGQRISIELSRDNGASWSIIEESVENSGSYSWLVNEQESDNVLVRIIDISTGKTSTHQTPIAIKMIGNLIVTFYLEYLADPYPSYQTTIWLENENGEFMQSLFVSDWLGRGGYAHRDVCSTWNAKANWTENHSEDVDAVTGATPEWGVDSQYTFDLSIRGIAPGTYKCNIETHISGEYNILYTGLINVNVEDSTVDPTPIYIPNPHESAGDILKNVKMIYSFTKK